MAQVVIAGAGIVGLATAIWLQRLGQDVVIVDRGEPELAASSGNAGVIASAEILPFATPQMARRAPRLMITPGSPLSMRWTYLPRALPYLLAHLRTCTASHVETYVRAMATLTADSQAQHAALAEGSGAASFLQSGDYCTGYATKEAWQADRAALALRERHGTEIETMDGAAFGAQESFYEGFFHKVVRMKNHGWITDPGGYLAALRMAFEQNGGQVVSATITDVMATPNPTLITSEGRISGARLVLALGAWSAPFARRLGLGRLRMESQRGYHLDLHSPSAMPQIPMKIPAHGVVVTPMRDRLRVAGLVEFGGLNAPPTARRLEQLKAVTTALFPSLCFNHTSSWMGHRPISPDSLPLIGPIDSGAKVFAAFGHQHMGMTTGPITGRLIAQMIMGKDVPDFVTAFEPVRYA